MFNTFFLLHGLIYQVLCQKNKETLQILLFASMLLSLVKKTALHFLFTVLSYVQGALQKSV